MIVRVGNFVKSIDMFIFIIYVFLVIILIYVLIFIYNLGEYLVIIF